MKEIRDKRRIQSLPEDRSPLKEGAVRERETYVGLQKSFPKGGNTRKRKTRSPERSKIKERKCLERNIL